jgi:hypothetical protein
VIADGRGETVDDPAVGEPELVAAGFVRVVTKVVELGDEGFGCGELRRDVIEQGAVGVRVQGVRCAPHRRKHAVSCDHAARRVDHEDPVDARFERGIDDGERVLEPVALEGELSLGSTLELPIKVLHLARRDADRSLEHVPFAIHVVEELAELVQ